MITTLAVISLLLQIVNVALTLRLISVTGRSAGWIFFAAAMALTAVRRLLLLADSPESAPADTFTQELLVLIGSVCVLIGLFKIRPLFENIQRTALESERRYRALTESSPLPFAVCRRGRIEFANRTAMAIFGIEQQEQVLHRPFIEVVAPQYRQIVGEQLATLSEKDPTRPLTEIRIQRPSGELIDVEIIIALFVFGEDLAEYVLIWDATNRKRHEEMLREREAELAHVMRLHTMGEIAAEMAHEINQPLYAISNFSQAGTMHLQSGDPSRLPQLQTCLEHIHSQAARAAQIVKNLRNFVSKSEGLASDVSLNQLIADSIELVSVQARRRRAFVETDAHAPDTTIRANAVQIQQVLVNLLINAFEAMEVLPEAQRTVRVSTRIEEESVELLIADSGPGVEEDQTSHFFEPFFTTKAHGMGMGLAVSRTIVTNHGGRIWVERNDRGGTTFHVSLPRDQPDLLTLLAKSTATNTVVI